MNIFERVFGKVRKEMSTVVLEPSAKRPQRVIRFVDKKASLDGISVDPSSMDGIARDKLGKVRRKPRGGYTLEG